MGNIGTEFGRVEFFEDFLTDNVTDLNEVVNGATENITDRHGGWWRQVLAGNGTDVAFLGAERAWETDEGPGQLIFEWRGYSTAVSVSSVFVGFSDDGEQSGAIVIENEGGGLNTVPVDAVGFLLEGPQDETWNAIGVQGDTDNSLVPLTLGADATDSGVQTLKMLLSEHNSGNVKFYIDGELVSSQNSYHASNIVYAPVISSDDRSTAFNLDTDYFYVSAPRS